MTPESRGSMILKRQEIDGSSSAVCAALDTLAHMPCCDILDESDEVLKPGFQLVYAIGDRRVLSALASRCAVLRCVLRALQFDPDVQRILSRDRVAVVYPPSSPERFLSEVRFLPSVEHASSRPDLLHALADAVLNPELHSMSGTDTDLPWLRSLVSVVGASTLKAFILDSHTCADHILRRDRCGEKSDYDALLALRGLIGFGLLEHCLSKRHRSDYGFAPELKRKRIAVPFRASDTPAQRAEFAHPDIALVLTTLAGLYSGLTEMQVSALPPARTSVYLLTVVVHAIFFFSVAS